MKIFAIIGVIVVVLLALTFVPKSALGFTPSYNVEIAATIKQQVAVCGVSFGLLPCYVIENVNTENRGESKILEWSNVMGVLGDLGSLTFCIDSQCQDNTEVFTPFTGFLGETRTSTETISYVPAGSHTLTITFFVDGVEKASYSGTVNV